ncbi:MAG: efflux transporter outer membrane subunit [Acidobacteria bacterium]|nr:efflux transporter outer membrane subunit [Acidobacteriota bacterium]
MMIRTALRLFLFAAATLAAGCAITAPPVERPETSVSLPDDWTAGEIPAGQVAPDWWTAFGDEELSQAIDNALTRNLDLQAAAARLEIAAADARAAASALNPSLQASYSGIRRKQNFIGFPIPGAGDRVLSTVFTNHGISLDTVWEVDLWGRLRTSEQAALADLQRVGADLRGAQLSLAGQTAKTWFAIAEARQQVLLSEATVDSFRESVDVVQQRFEAGVRPALDLRLALLNLSNAEAQLAERRRQLDASLRQLDLLLARYASGNITPPSELPAMPPPVPGGVPADLVARRPDLAAAERQVAASEARLHVARRQLLPGISLTANTGTATNSLLSLLNGDFGVWGIVANVVAPLWQGGRLRVDIDRAEAQVAEVLANYVNTALTAYSEVETALAAEEYLADRVTHLATSVEQSRAAERLADERYRAGLDTYITVLDSQRSAFQAESEHIAAQRLRLENRVDLYLALGGGFEQLEAPVTIASRGDSTTSEPETASNGIAP